MKTRQGLATVAFSTEHLAQRFLQIMGLREYRILPLSQFHGCEDRAGTTRLLRSPVLKIVFPSQQVLDEWAADKERFDSAPYVSELATPTA